MNQFYTDICIIGAGPAGLFAVFEAGLLKLRCHLIDVLPDVGGQLREIYPQKPIYDIPGFPIINAGDLINNLTAQIAPFAPTYSLGEKVVSLQKHSDGSFLVRTNEETEVNAKVVVIAAGLGCFEPRKPLIDHLEDYEGRGVSYFVKNPEVYRNKKIVVAGGGDSALDWAIMLAEIADGLTLVHRGNMFRGAPDSAEKVFKLADEGKIDLKLHTHIVGLSGTGHLQHVHLENQDKSTSIIDAEHLIPLFGLTPMLGPIADWGLNLNNSAIAVNTLDYSTNIPGIYAIGDINSYPGKLKLILCGFHEAALMAQSAFKYIHPQERLTFKYTTVYGVNKF